MQTKCQPRIKYCFTLVIYSNKLMIIYNFIQTLIASTSYHSYKAVFALQRLKSPDVSPTHRPVDVVNRDENDDFQWIIYVSFTWTYKFKAIKLLGPDIMGLTSSEKFMIYARLSLNYYLRSEERLTIIFYLKISFKYEMDLQSPVLFLKNLLLILTTQQCVHHEYRFLKASSGLEV